jgi:glycerophosphoryl diester phosphodiesterase
MDKDILIIAHRGTTIKHLENSLDSFIFAGEKGYKGAECDIHLTKDFKLVVFHDEFTGRLSSSNVEIKNTSFKDLSKIILNQPTYKKTYRIPTYKEYLQVCKHYDMQAIVELKAKFDDKTIKYVLDDSKTYSIDKITFIAFDINNLLLIKKYEPAYKLQLLTVSIDNDIINICKLNGFDLDTDKIVLTKENIELCHKEGILINTWTVDDEKQASQLIDYGVDMITTNVLPSNFK